MMSENITVEALKELMDTGADFILLDVREQPEVDAGVIGEGVHIPLAHVPHRFNELDASKHIVVYCRAGGRSAQAMDFLKMSGFEKVQNLEGGIKAWAARIDNTVVVG